MIGISPRILDRAFRYLELDAVVRGLVPITLFVGEGILPAAAIDRVVSLVASDEIVAALCIDSVVAPEYPPRLSLSSVPVSWFVASNRPWIAAKHCHREGGPRKSLSELLSRSTVSSTSAAPLVTTTELIVPPVGFARRIGEARAVDGHGVSGAVLVDELGGACGCDVTDTIQVQRPEAIESHSPPNQLEV